MKKTRECVVFGYWSIHIADPTEVINSMLPLFGTLVLGGFFAFTTYFLLFGKKNTPKKKWRKYLLSLEIFLLGSFLECKNEQKRLRYVCGLNIHHWGWARPTAHPRSPNQRGGRRGSTLNPCLSPSLSLSLSFLFLSLLSLIFSLECFRSLPIQKDHANLSQDTGRWEEKRCLFFVSALLDSLWFSTLLNFFSLGAPSSSWALGIRARNFRSETRQKQWRYLPATSFSPPPCLANKTRSLWFH